MLSLISPNKEREITMTPPASSSAAPFSKGGDHLNRLWKRGQEFLGVRFSILGGAMTWVSERSLVSAISNAGGFGVIASGSMDPQALRAEIKGTRALTKEPFGVNLITLHPNLAALIQVCCEEGVGHVVLAGGVPTAEAMALVKGGGARVLCFAPSLLMARKLIRMGADALILEGMEAGGHIGPLSTTVLAQEILPHISEVPVFIAGGIGRGEAILSYLEMGAAGCQLGTRFVCAQESTAHPRFKEAFLKANARDAVVSPQVDSRFPVIPVRALHNQATTKFVALQHQVIQRVQTGELSLKEGQLEIEHFWAGALRRAAVEGDIEGGSLMAGQSVGMVTSQQTVQEILLELVHQARSALEHRAVVHKP